MVKRIVLLSGHVSAGKTTLAGGLEKSFGMVVFRTREHLKRLEPEVERYREAMQDLGERLDRSTGGRWVADGLGSMIRDAENNAEDILVVVDAVRIKAQIDAIRRAYPYIVTHVHLDAPEPELARRYRKKSRRALKEFDSYERVLENCTENAVGKLLAKADIVIDTKRCSIEDVLVKTASKLGLYGRQNLRLVDVLVGGQYGSEGKGNISAYLACEYDILLRVGGPNAGHKTYAEPYPHTFHHLPSGTVDASNARLVIGPGATIYVPGLFDEIGRCKVGYRRLAIDPRAMIISEKDRKREARLTQEIGSTGQGVGAANARRILERWKNGAKLAKDIRELKPFLQETRAVLDSAFEKGQKVFLEGTQGTGLSLYHGSYPYVTSRDTTVSGCLAEAGISPSQTRKIIMVCRTYPIRVESPRDGSSGPMNNEISWTKVAKRSGYSPTTLRKNEKTSTTNRKRRVSEFDWALLRRAASLNAPTDIALTFVDYIKRENERARRFEQLNDDTIRFIEEVESVGGAPVSLISTRFDYRNIIDRRRW